MSGPLPHPAQPQYRKPGQLRALAFAFAPALLAALVERQRAAGLLELVRGVAACVAGEPLPDAPVATIGASGAVAAVLGGYILLYPRARVITLIFIVFFFTIIELPAMLILGFWFLQQVAFGYFDLASPAGEGGGVAYFAHIGGFVFGLLAIKLFASRQKDYTPPPKYPVY
ncbi:MAG: rhomboid family intramembrane serine protease [Actinobacteria bacterium]|nr:rhomboid family intramembrane serine protease [Actinomycetota bacterium]